ncbi:MAG: hypothetical protein P8R54_08565 [Myxococcota bacterium]|nr:hypothetical protein [Myxococcota bacterium]
MAEKRLVIGSGPDALRAAAVLASGGYAVTLLQEGDTPSGLSRPKYPNDAGWMRVTEEAWSRVEAVLGPVVEAPDPMRSVGCRGHRYRLPMKPHHIPRLLSGRVRLPAARSWLQARAKLASSELFGGGQEERTYQDWVARRMGGPAYHHLYRDYAFRRWGWDPADLSSALAQVHHAMPDPGPFQVAGGGYDEVLRSAEKVIIAAGGEILTGVTATGLRVQDGKVIAAVSTAGEHDVSGDVWLALDATTICRLLGDACAEGMRVDASHLPVAMSVVTALRGEVDGLPDELHVLDEGAPFWQVVVPYGIEKTALFHTTILSPDARPPESELIRRCIASAGALGIGEFSEEGAHVEWLPRWMPVWRKNSHARFRRLLRTFGDLGIIGVGRSGAFSAMDPGTEIALVDRLMADPDQTEAHRLILDPPVRIESLDAHITRMIER